MFWNNAILIACGVVFIIWMWHFPYPSPLIRPFLPPKLRWPESLIRKWAGNGNYTPVFIRFFERDPDRTIPDKAGILGPADGLITSIDCRDGIRYVVIALSFWDVHVQRSPITGRIASIESLGHEYMDGEGRDFAFLAEKHCPVQLRIVIQSTPFDYIAIRLITSFSARRLESLVNMGDAVERGQRIGKILLGSTVVLELPEKYPMCLKPGERVWAGETLVSEYSIL